MIVSVSRRTDIPAHYARWFFNRLAAGRVSVPNPRNPHQVRNVSLAPEDVDGFVFWTKDFRPMMPYLRVLEPYPFYVQYTVTGYGADLEPAVPPKWDIVLPSLQDLSDAIGPERVVWRYDPIVMGNAYSLAYHLDCFERMAGFLSGHIRRCVISFVDLYRNVRRPLALMGFREPTRDERLSLAEGLAQRARAYGMEIVSCAEAEDLSDFGIAHGACIDASLLSAIAGRPITVGKDRNQRSACLCAASVDIGMYDTCAHGCRYCYADSHSGAVRSNLVSHDPDGPSLIPFQRT